MQPPNIVPRNVLARLLGARRAQVTALVTLSLLSSAALATELATTPQSTSPQLHGSVTISVPDSFTTCITNLVDSAEKQNVEFTRFQDAVDKYSTTKNKVAARTFDALNYTLMFKGISPSCEAGDIVLDEKNKLKSLASAKYLRQKLHDELQLKIISHIMQMAMALGNDDVQASAKQLQQGEQDLKNLVGDEQTSKAVAMLKAMRDQNADKVRTSIKPSWSLTQTRTRIESAVQAAATTDPIVKELQDDVHRFNKHRTSTMVGHRMVRVALSTVSLAPSIVGPAAQALMFGYLAVTGGTEQEKLLRELYLDKRLSCRARLLSEQAHLAFENYQLAALTNNKLLMDCSEQLVGKMTNPDLATKLLTGSDYKEAAQQAVSKVE